MLEGQIENARKVFELRKGIPFKLRPFLDFRAKATGVTLVSFFDFAAMRGLDIKKDGATKILKALEMQQDFLISPEKDDKEKIEKLSLLGFKSRGNREELLEEDVQAFLVRELLCEDQLRDLPQRICEICGCSQLKYLTSEFEWSLGGKKDRADVLCYDQNDTNRIVIVELKKVRITQLKQARYVQVFQRHQDEIRKFTRSLTGKSASAGDLEVYMVYLMPDHPRLDTKEWEHVVRCNNIDGIIFYNRGFSSGSLVKKS